MSQFRGCSKTVHLICKCILTRDFQWFQFRNGTKHTNDIWMWQNHRTTTSTLHSNTAHALSLLEESAWPQWNRLLSKRTRDPRFLQIEVAVKIVVARQGATTDHHGICKHICKLQILSRVLKFSWAILLKTQTAFTKSAPWFCRDTRFDSSCTHTEHKTKKKWRNPSRQLVWYKPPHETQHHHIQSLKHVSAPWNWVSIKTCFKQPVLLQNRILL